MIATPKHCLFCGAEIDPKAPSTLQEERGKDDIVYMHNECLRSAQLKLREEMTEK